MNLMQKMMNTMIERNLIISSGEYNVDQNVDSMDNADHIY
jgi:hypothetical protein